MAEIAEIHGHTIFDSSCQTLVNPVNCVGVMGRGLALEFKMRFPAMYEQYRAVCDRRGLHPGMLLLFKTSTPWILNFPTKDHWKHPARLEYLESGLRKFAATYADKGITSIAFPKLGTTSGKLDWAVVGPIMYRYLKPLPNLRVEIYHFDPNARDTFFDSLYQKLQRMGVDDYTRHLGLKKRQAQQLYDAIAEGRVTNMLDIQSIHGLGEKSIAAIYEFARGSATDGDADRQMRLL